MVQRTVHLVLTEAGMEKRRTIDLNPNLISEAAVVLGTTDAADTVRAALRAVVARGHRRWLARRDFSELSALLPTIRDHR